MERKVISKSTIHAIDMAKREGVEIGRPKITTEKVKQICFLYENKKMSMRQISKVMNVSIGSISKYVNQKK